MRMFGLTLLALASMLGTLTGCVSAKYKMAPKETPPPLALNLNTTQPSAAVVLHTVIVYKGPGSWKNEAYWDEYVCTIANRGTSLLTVESAVLTDALGAEQICGSDPWVLEKISRENLKKYSHLGRKILLGVGLTAGWAFSGGVAVAAAWAGSAPLAAVAGATFFAIPVWAVGSGVRILVARSAIREEFNRRRIATPLVLQPGETKQGSLFFPVSPGPQRMVLRCSAEGAPQNLTLDLAPLAGLHLLKEVAAPAPAAPAKP